jgi:hypothetical protein
MYHLHCWHHSLLIQSIILGIFQFFLIPAVNFSGESSKIFNNITDTLKIEIVLAARFRAQMDPIYEKTQAKKALLCIFKPPNGKPAEESSDFIVILGLEHTVI